VPSSRNPQRLGTPHELEAKCLSTAVLEAILCPEWEIRYYSFDAKWSEGERLASMRNGQGDHYIIVFSEHGVYLQGFAHESPMSPWREDPPVLWLGLHEGLPEQLQQYRDEIAFRQDEVTFCLWWDNSRPGWQCGVKAWPEHGGDGSENLLVMQGEGPEYYKTWAEEYHFECERELPLGLVKAVYAQRELSAEEIRALNPEADIDEVRAELAEMGYPTR